MYILTQGNRTIVYVSTEDMDSIVISNPDERPDGYVEINYWTDDGWESLFGVYTLEGAKRQMHQLWQALAQGMDGYAMPDYDGEEEKNGKNDRDSTWHMAAKL